MPAYEREKLVIQIGLGIGNRRPWRGSRMYDRHVLILSRRSVGGPVLLHQLQGQYYGRPKFMKKSIKVDQKKRRGRPATGRDPMVSSRMPKETIAAVDKWAAKNETTRSDAIARLVELGLKKG